MEKDKILLHAPNYTALKGMLALASQLEDYYDPIILSEIPGKKINLRHGNLTRTSLVFGKVLKTIAKLIIISHRKKYLVQGKPAWAYQLLVLISILHYKVKAQYILEIFKLTSPRAVFLYTDRHDGWTSLIISQSVKQAIPSLVLPISYQAQPKSIMRVRRACSKELASHDITYNSEFKARYQKQWRHDEVTGKDISFYPPWITEAKAYLKLLSDDPWIPGCSDIKYLCVSGEKDKQRLIEEGAPLTKIKVTGSYEHDRIYEKSLDYKQSRTLLNIKYELSSKRLLLVALPQLYEHSLVSYQRSMDLLEEIVDQCLSDRWETLFSLHPKIQNRELTNLLDSKRCHIASEPLETIIASCDTFVAWKASSTVDWAVLTLKPLIMLDLIPELSSPINNWIQGALVVKESCNLQEEISRTFEDNELRLSLINKHLEIKDSLSPFDGRSRERILNLANLFPLE